MCAVFAHELDFISKLEIGGQFNIATIARARRQIAQISQPAARFQLFDLFLLIPIQRVFIGIEQDHAFVAVDDDAVARRAAFRDLLQSEHRRQAVGARNDNTVGIDAAKIRGKSADFVAIEQYGQRGRQVFSNNDCAAGELAQMCATVALQVAQHAVFNILKISIAMAEKSALFQQLADIVLHQLMKRKIGVASLAANFTFHAAKKFRIIQNQMMHFENLCGSFAGLFQSNVLVEHDFVFGLLQGLAQALDLARNFSRGELLLLHHRFIFKENECAANGNARRGGHASQNHLGFGFKRFHRNQSHIVTARRICCQKDCSIRLTRFPHLHL